MEKLIKRQIKFARLGTSLTLDEQNMYNQYANIYKSMSEDQRKAYYSKYGYNAPLSALSEFMMNLTTQPSNSVLNTSTNHTPLVEPSNTSAGLYVSSTPYSQRPYRVKAGANNAKWNYQRLQAAKLLGINLNSAEDVAKLQRELGVAEDGMFGLGTLNAYNSKYGKNIALGLILYVPLQSSNILQQTNSPLNTSPNVDGTDDENNFVTLEDGRKVMRSVMYGRTNPYAVNFAFVNPNMGTFYKDNKGGLYRLSNDGKFVTKLNVATATSGNMKGLPYYFWMDGNVEHGITGNGHLVLGKKTKTTSVKLGPIRVAKNSGLARDGKLTVQPGYFTSDASFDGNSKLAPVDNGVYTSSRFVYRDINGLFHNLDYNSNMNAYIANTTIPNPNGSGIVRGFRFNENGERTSISDYLDSPLDYFKSPLEYYDSKFNK